MAAARQVRPPKPSRQAHCPVNCGGERVSERDSPAHPSRRGSRQDTSSAVRPRTAPPQAHVFGPAKAESHREGRSGGSPGAWGPARRYLVALGAEGVVRVAGTGLAAPAAGQLPVVGGTLVTLGAHHVGQTQAAPSLLVTRHVPPGAQDTAVTPCTGEGPLSWGRGTQICPHHPPEDTHQGGEPGGAAPPQKTWKARPPRFPSSPSTWPLGQPPASPGAGSVPLPGQACRRLLAQPRAHRARGAGPAPGPLPRPTAGWDPLLTVAALRVGEGKPREPRLAQITAFPLHVLLAHTLASQGVTGRSRHCPVGITLAGCKTKAAPGRQRGKAEHWERILVQILIPPTPLPGLRPDHLSQVI